MIRRFLAISLLSPSVFLLCQCGSDAPGPVLVGQAQGRIEEGDALFRKAEAEERKGDLDDAIDLYEEVASHYGFSNHAAEARYRQAKLLEREGNLRESFAAYDMYVANYPSGSKYGEVIERMFEIAMMAKSGKIEGRFLVFKQKVPVTSARFGEDLLSTFARKKPGILQMLTIVKLHAPKSSMAAKAQYAIGEVYLADNKYTKSVTEFRRVAEDHRSHALAPEALFRVGEILLEEAERGNQNQATIDLAREAFNDYLNQFPGHKRNAEARKLIANLGSREVAHTMEIAEYYYNLGQMESAKVYYRDVVKRTKSGKLHDRASARLKELGN